MLTGAFVALLPFLGFPASWDTVFFFLAGLLVIGLGILVRYRLGYADETEHWKHKSTYTENQPAQAGGSHAETNGN